jgi:hypothetical protein
MLIPIYSHVGIRLHWSVDRMRAKIQHPPDRRTGAENSYVTGRGEDVHSPKQTLKLW